MEFIRLSNQLSSVVRSVDCATPTTVPTTPATFLSQSQHFGLSLEHILDFIWSTLGKERDEIGRLLRVVLRRDNNERREWFNYWELQ